MDRPDALNGTEPQSGGDDDQLNEAVQLSFAIEDGALTPRSEFARSREPEVAAPDTSCSQIFSKDIRSI